MIKIVMAKKVYYKRAEFFGLAKVMFHCHSKGRDEITPEKIREQF